MDIHGLDVTIEKRKGETRSGIGKDGTLWVSDPLPCAYGCIKGYRAKDGESVDAYVGPDKTSTKVWVVDQVKDGGAYDEAKVLLGFGSKADALSHYRRAFSDGRGASRIGGVAELDISGLKAALADGKLKKPMAKKTGGSLDMARAYAMGGRVRYDVGGEVPLSDIVTEDQMPPRPVYGERPSLPETSWLDAPAWGTRNKSWRDLLGALKDEVAYNASLPIEFSGVPSMLRGVDTLRDDDPGLLHKASGLSSVVMGGIPAASTVRPVGKVIEALTGTLPRYLTTYGLLGAPRVLEEAIPAAKAAEAGAPERYDGPARPKQQVEQLQQQLKDAGFNVKVDGNDGGATRDAELLWKKKMAAEERRLKIEEEAAQTRATEAKTAAGKAKADEESAARNVQARKDYEKDKSPWHTAVQVGVPYALPLLGGALGGYWGHKTAEKGTKVAQEALDAANRIIKGGAKYKADPKNLNERIGNLNKFWSEGSASKVAPFEHAAKKPFWKPSKSAEPAESLYPPASRKMEHTLNAGLGSILGISEGVLGYYMLGHAERDLENAQAAAEKDANPITLNALDVAKDKVAIAEGLLRMAPATAIGKIGMGSYGIHRRPSQRPNVNKADAERAAIAEVLAKRKSASKPSSKVESQGSKRQARRSTDEGSGPGSPGSGLAAIAPIGASALLSRAERSPELLQTESDALVEPFAKGGEVKHHSHFQPRNPIGKFAGGPVYPHKESGGSVGEKQAPALTALLEVARDYAARPVEGSLGKRGSPPYLLQDYGMDKATNDLVFSPRPKRDNGGPVEEVEAPQPDYTYGKPRFPNLDPRAYFDEPTMSRYANEGNLSRAKEAAIAALPAMALSAGLRDRSLAKVLDAKAIFDNGPYKFDRGVTGGQRDAAAWRNSPKIEPSYIDSSTDLVTGYPHAFPRARISEPPAKPANDYLPEGWSIAKQYGGPVGYDHGGVVTGGIVGDHGGRADTRPVSVPSGSYVLPADVVSAIGQSNSLAGIRMCDRMFGKPSSGKAAGGPAQAVAIRISDGEYALSPDQVARVGGGSIEDGHRVLDKFTLAVRKKHTEDLKRLPAPARD